MCIWYYYTGITIVKYIALPILQVLKKYKKNNYWSTNVKNYSVAIYFETFHTTKMLKVCIPGLALPMEGWKEEKRDSNKGN